MAASTLPRLAVLLLLALAACKGSDSPTARADTPDPSGWRLSTGKAPSTAEFAALAATCETKGGAIDPCLTDLGLKKAP